ncbi:lycopene cyclase [Mycobacterium sp. CBMA 623]|nr:lycopene cyclase [Mycobacteroides sp. CBMA 326]
MAALHVLRHTDSKTLRLSVIDPDARTGPGLPYRTEDPRHLLNVPAGKLSADIGEPLDFVAWLADNSPLSAGPEDYVPRGLFGRYLSGVFERAGDDRVTRIHRRAVGARRRGDGISVTLCNGENVYADAVILAAGPNNPGTSWAPVWLRDNAVLVGDPWRPGALGDVPDEGDLLLVGTGLTMADLACTLRRPGRVLHAISRSGLLPRAHLPKPQSPPVAPTFTLERGRVLERAVRYVQEVIAAGGDACAAVDALRPRAGALWTAMTVEEHEKFLRKYRRLWDIHRHRMAPQTAARIDEHIAVGELRTHRAELVDAGAADPGARVTLSSGEVLDVRAVINCTGPQYDITASTDPLWREMLAGDLVRPGPLNLGLDTDSEGRLSPGDAPMWALGPLRRGNLWETTAFAEIRAQARELAALIVS